MSQDPRIDAYIAKAAPFAQPILHHLRALMHDAIPEVEETIKWGMPHFLYKGKNIAGIAAFKAHASFTIHGEAAANEAREVQKGMGHFGKIGSLADLPADDVLKSRIAAAVARIEIDGTAYKRKPTGPRQPKPELPIPREFAAALDAAPMAKVTLEAFAPSHRREYVEWVSSAKRSEIRDKRIAEAIGMLSEGKKRNWKYENC